MIETIKTYRDIGIELNTFMEEETWDVLLRVFVGITDYLLNIKYYKDKILLGRIFFILLLQSRLKNLDEFSPIISKWISHEFFLNLWYGVCQGLTEKALNLFYNGIQPNENSSKKCIIENDIFMVLDHDEKNQKTIMITMEIEDVIFIWFYLITLPKRTNIKFDKNELARYKKFQFNLMQNFFKINKNKYTFMTSQIKEQIPEICTYNCSNYESFKDYVIDLKKVLTRIDYNENYITGIALLDIFGYEHFFSNLSDSCKLLTKFIGPYELNHLYFLYSIMFTQIDEI